MPRIRLLLSSPQLTVLTHRIFYLLLLLSNILLPAGQHRIWGGLGRWWVFPLTAAVTYISIQLYLNGHGSYWRLAAVPYALLYVHDALAVTEVSANSPSAEK
jgi:hypothetical protein